MKYTLLAAVCCVLSLSACTKKKKATCSPMLYGYSSPGAPWSSTGPLTVPNSFGNINPSTLTSSSIGMVNTSLFSNQGTFNTIDKGYYVLEYSNLSAADKLHKITTSGAVTTYTNSAGRQYTEALVFDPVTQKLYCLLCSPGTAAAVAEITFSGLSYTVTPIASATVIQDTVIPATSAVDNNTGDIYFSMSTPDKSSCSIEKYHPGTTTTTVIAGGSNMYYLGLRFDPNDNMLYAISETSFYYTDPAQFVKITPGGAIGTLARLPWHVYAGLYSTVLDRCNDKYIISAITGNAFETNVVMQFSTSGAVMQYDTTAGLYQGLEILYQ